MILKQLPEDFIVNEVLQLQFDNSGEYSYYQLTKKNMNTIDAVERIAVILGVQIKHINFAGTKDKQAVTTQHISIFKGPNKDITKEFAANNAADNAFLPFLHLSYLGKGKERLNLGSLEGNSFAITVRGAEKRPAGITTMVNYFDDQRFGINRNNHLIGKLLIKQQFKQVCCLLGLAVEKNDFVGALQRLHKKKLQLYVHAYQSYLFNEVCKQYLVKKYKSTKKISYSLGDLAILDKGQEVTVEEKEKKIPIIGFGFDTEEVQDKLLRTILIKIIEKEDITSRDFVIRPLQGLSSEGGGRALFTSLENVEMQEIVDEIASKTYKILFRLQKGSYATIAVKSMFA